MHLRSVSTWRSTSKPGSTSRGQPPPRVRRSATSLAASPAGRGTEAERDDCPAAGIGVGSRLRRMSHISRPGSRFVGSAQPRPTSGPTCPKPRPPGPDRVPPRSGCSPDARVRPRSGRGSTMPASSSSPKRLDSSVGDIRGTPRRRSLKRVEPRRSSRIRTIGPARAQHLGGHRDRAELPVAAPSRA
jgi:hypothetical protein